jgi:hypothetical protein
MELQYRKENGKGNTCADMGMTLPDSQSMHKGGRIEMFSAFDRQGVKNIGTWKVRNMETGQHNFAKHTGKLDRIILKQLV